jgi:hypothetical protein
VFEKREHVNYLKEVKFSERRRREAVRMTWALEVAGSFEMTVCESVGITRSQPTPKSFRVDTSDVVTLQTVESWKNCAVQDISESLPASSECARQTHSGGRV